MRGEINLRKCLVCGDKITKGLFCAKHVNAIADALRMAGAARTMDRTGLKAEAEARHAAHQAKKAPR